MLVVVGQQKLRKIKKQKQLTQNSWWGGRTRKTEEDKETVASNTRLSEIKNIHFMLGVVG